jgi:hypothetical protein
MGQPERPALLVWADHCTCGKVHIDVYDGDGAPLTGQRDIVRALRAAARAIESGKAQRLETLHGRSGRNH